MDDERAEKGLERKSRGLLEVLFLNVAWKKKTAENYRKSSERFVSVLAVIRRECLPNKSTEFFKKLR